MVVFCLLILAGRYLFFTQQYLNTYESPDKKYTLIVKKAKMRTAMPGNGGTSNAPLLIVLKDSKGNVLSQITSDSECATFYDSVKVEWGLENLCHS